MKLHSGSDGLGVVEVGHVDIRWHEGTSALALLQVRQGQASPPTSDLPLTWGARLNPALKM